MAKRDAGKTDDVDKDALNQLKEFLMIMAGGTVLPLLVLMILFRPTRCAEVPDCLARIEDYPYDFLHQHFASMLSAMALIEFVGLVTPRALGGKLSIGRHPSYFELKPKGGGASMLLIIMLMILTIKEANFQHLSQVFAHAAGQDLARPVFTFQFIEWLINVPILMILAGYHALHQPLKAILRPALVTNVYVTLCWAAAVSASPMTQWILYLIAACMYIFTCVDMSKWMLHHDGQFNLLATKLLRQLSPILLMTYFFVYGMVYTAALLGSLSVVGEHTAYTVLTCTSKIIFSAGFVALRTSDYLQRVSQLLNCISYNNGVMLNSLLTTYDVILDCTFDKGTKVCKIDGSFIGDCRSLDDRLGYELTGKNLFGLVRSYDKKPLARYILAAKKERKKPKDALSMAAPTFRTFLKAKRANGAAEDAPVLLCAVIPDGGRAGDGAVYMAVRVITPGVGWASLSSATIAEEPSLLAIGNRERLTRDGSSSSRTSSSEPLSTTSTSQDPEAEPIDLEEAVLAFGSDDMVSNLKMPLLVSKTC
eukprot:TRINITY_DN48169_c0_g1_i1.p1 TRINITY_DN48169_c0_g1~~TRINITY_DN48169_c0_g1_i1.p1  ORF type:complete len:536 (-),score=66.96 TRINITY_DN48169_c0_g1_i1:68-1675(-)